MRSLRGVFFTAAAAAACFMDNSVKREVAVTARVFVAIFSALFLVAEVIDLLS
jgi:hypothetical protein